MVATLRKSLCYAHLLEISSLDKRTADADTRKTPHETDTPQCVCYAITESIVSAYKSMPDSIAYVSITALYSSHCIKCD